MMICKQDVQNSKAQVICLAMQNSAERTVASEAGADTAVPVDLFMAGGRCTAAPQFTIVVWVLQQLKPRRLGSKLQNPPTRLVKIP
jgi:hypothetical protein